jgi:hypothetical protein
MRHKTPDHEMPDTAMRPDSTSNHPVTPHAKIQLEGADLAARGLRTAAVQQEFMEAAQAGNTHRTKMSTT